MPRTKKARVRVPFRGDGVGLLRSKVRLIGVALIGAKVAAVPLVFDPSLDMPFVVSKAVVGHALALGLAATVLGLTAQFGRAFITRSPLHVAVVLFALVSALAAGFALQPSLAINGTHARMLGLASILDGVVLYLAIVLLLRTRADATAVISVGFAAAAPVLGYELMQMLSADPFGWVNADPTRPFSTLGQATALASYLLVLALGGFAYAAVAKLPTVLRVLVLVYSALLLSGSLATGTRSSLVGLVVGTLIGLVGVWFTYRSRRARGFVAGGVVAAAAALITVVLFTPVGERILATIEPASVESESEVGARVDASVEGRLALYEIGIRIVRDRPALGYGPDSFVIGVPMHRPENAPPHIRTSVASSPHSWTFQVSTGSGLIGLASFAAIAIVAVGLAFRRPPRAVAVAGASMLGGFLGAGLTSPNELGTEWLFWASTAAIAVSTAHVPQASYGSSGNARRNGRPARGTRGWIQKAPPVLLAAAVIAGATGVNALEASRSAKQSQELRLGGRQSLAISAGLRATRLDPNRSEYWHALGLAYVSLGRWSDSVLAFGHTVALAPYDARYIGDLARAELLLGSSGDLTARGRAREHGDRAVNVDPNNPRSHLTRAIVLQALGDVSGALGSIERALALDRESVDQSIYVTSTQLLRAAGRTKEAIEVARRGVEILSDITPALALRLELARSLLVSGEPEEALTVVEVVLAFRPGDSEASRLRAEILNALSN